MDKIKVIVVAGPTASGKSDLAIQLAQKYDGEIISADSRQVYRGMDIGTGKVTKREQKMARHWMLDVASPLRQYSVAKWKTAAQRAIRDIARRGKTPIICGGTGFWIDALVYDMALPSVKPDSAMRKRLSAMPTEWLYAKLLASDPTRAASIDRHNPRRLIRALEIVMTTGQPVPQPRRWKSPYTLLYLGISLPKEILQKRIAKRLDVRLKAGMVAEVKRLRTSGVSYKRLESFGLEYRWVSQYLQKKTTRAQMRDGLLRDIVRYAKRQMTWFRRNKDIAWITGPAQTMRLCRRYLSALR